MTAVGADGQRVPVRPVRKAKFIVCVCGRELKGGAAFANHAKKCPRSRLARLHSSHASSGTVSRMADHYTDAERRAQGKKLARARAAATEALRIAEVMARAALTEGIPETQIAAELGVDRMTVRKWAGKR